MRDRAPAADAGDLNHPADAPTRRASDAVDRSIALLAAARATGRAVSDDLRACAARLGAIDPTRIPQDGGARAAFWINVYNALMLHAVAAYALTEGERVPLTVFRRAAYGVGGARWSLHDIEHGVLRRNRPAPYTFWRPFSAKDPRAAAMPRAFDPRVHFALNCAAASCPPVRAYTAAGLHAELDLATRAYVSQETLIDREENAVKLPYLCSLYDRDFGDARAALRWVEGYLNDDERAWVASRGAGAKLSFNGYRWDLVR